MFIIIEGPDGSGKTSLARRLEAQTGYKYTHMSYPKNLAEADAMYAAYAELIHSNKNIILDRAWYSEMIYGPIKRGRSVISYLAMYSLENAIANGAGGLVILCTAPVKTLQKRCVVRGEDYIALDQIKYIHDDYEDLMFNAPHNIPIVRYEYNGR